MSRLQLAALAAGTLSGLTVLASMLAGIAGIPLIFIALTPTFAVGLSLGLGPALMALAAAAAASWLAGSLVLGAEGGFYVALNYALAFGLPQAWLMRLALISREGPSGRQWYPPGRLLAWLVGLAVAFLAAAEIAFWGSEGGLAGAIRGPELELAVRAVGEFRGTPMAESEVAATASVVASIMPAMVANSWLVMMLVNGALAQAVLARAGRALRPSVAFADLQLPMAMLYLFGGALALSFAPEPVGALGRAAVMVVSLAYLVLGLAVIHALVRRLAARQIILFGTYLLLIVMSGLAIVVALLGLVEQGVGLRKRFNAGPKGRKEE
jgi:hypothetical protein